MTRKLNDRTTGLLNFVQHALDKVKAGDVKEAELVLIDLINDIGGAYVCVQRKPKKVSPVGNYKAQEDGDYSGWLAANNID
jgi:hypothetical protein